MHTPQTRKWRTARAVAIASLLAAPTLAAAPALAQTSLLANGDFENGLAGWTVASTLTGDKYDPSDPQAALGSYDAANYPQDPGTPLTTPISQLVSTPDTSALVSPGNGFALSDMNAPGSHALYQSFTATTSAVTVSWSQFVYDWAGFDPAAAAANNQFARVDLLLSSAITSDPFTGSVTHILYGPSVDPESSQGLAPRWRNYSTTVTNLTAGERYALRFQTTDTLFVLNHALDNARVLALPEPATAPLTLLPTVLLGLTLYRRRYR